ncbi:hypothetical protein [Thioclava sp. GXIMD4215]|uniref:hypothetical protein n=1 Tax=Thioclava sp. GXIMD4215 TaxID=3131928 RepID=UPI00311ACB09
MPEALSLMDGFGIRHKVEGKRVTVFLRRGLLPLPASYSGTLTAVFTGGSFDHISDMGGFGLDAP